METFDSFPLIVFVYVVLTFVIVAVIVVDIYKHFGQIFDLTTTTRAVSEIPLD